MLVLADGPIPSMACCLHLSSKQKRAALEEKEKYFQDWNKYTSQLFMNSSKLKVKFKDIRS